MALVVKTERGGISMRKKKILVGALAVVLAVSMLTACGGPENGGNGGSDTEQKPSSQPDQGEGKEDGKDDGDKGNGTESPVEPVTGKSRTEKYFARVQDVGVKYHSAVEHWKNGTAVEREEYASDGVRTYQKIWTKKYGWETHVIDVNQQMVWTYDKEKKTAYCKTYKDSAPVLDLPSILSPKNYLVEKEGYQVGTEVVDNITYTSEYFTDLFGKKISYCFDKDDLEGEELRCMVIDYPDGNREWIKVLLCNQTEFDLRLLRVPEGYEYYRVDDNEPIEDLGTTPQDNYPD